LPLIQDHINQPPRFALQPLVIGPVSCVLAAEGELDLATTPGLWCALDQHFAAGRRVVELDVARLSIFDGAALGCLVQIQCRLAEVGGRLVLTRCPRASMRLLEVTGLTEFLHASGVSGANAVPGSRLPTEAHDGQVSSRTMLG